MGKNKITWWNNQIKKKDLIKYISISKNFSQGYNIQKFEKQLAKKLSVKYCVTTSSGSNALILAINCLDLKPGDEIIVPSRTWIASAHAIVLFRLKVKLVDVDHRALIDTKYIESKITNKTKAIMIVHLGGRTCNVDYFKNLCKKKNIFLIEDAAQAFMSKYKKSYVGSKSDIGCFSLGPTKILNTIYGGFCTTNSKKFYNKLLLTRNHGVTNNFTKNWKQLGFNFKYSDFQSKIGLSELLRIKSKINKSNQIYKLYKKKIIKNKIFNLIDVNFNNGEIPIYVEAICNHRNKLIKFMEENNIQIRRMLPSINKAKYLKNNQKFKNSSMFDKFGVFLPCGPDQKISDIKTVIQKINQFILKNNYEKL